jgi:hypothetical protein
VTKIKASPERFASKLETDRIKLSPSPSTYLKAEAFDFSTTPVGKLKLGNDKRQSFVDT